MSFGQSFISLMNAKRVDKGLNVNEVLLNMC